METATETAMHELLDSTVLFIGISLIEIVRQINVQNLYSL